jgi:hypothetical protein
VCCVHHRGLRRCRRAVFVQLCVYELLRHARPVRVHCLCSSVTARNRTACVHAVHVV